MIPPTTSDLGLADSGLSDNAVSNNGTSNNGTSETAPQSNGHATGTLVPYQQSRVPAEMSQDWGYDTAGWGPDNSSSQGINPLDFLYALRRRWILATGLSVSISLLVMGLLFLLVPVYHVATLFMQVHALQRGSGSNNVIRLTPDYIKRIQETVSAQAKSPLVLEAIVRPPQIQELSMIKNEVDQVKFLTEELRVGFMGNSEIMYFRLSGENPNEVVKIVNEWYTAFDKEVVAREKNEKRTERGKMHVLLTARSSALREERRKLRGIRLDSNAPTSEIARQRVLANNTELNLLAVQKRETERNYIAAFQELELAEFRYEKNRKGNLDPLEIDGILNLDRVYQDLKARAAEALQYYQVVAGSAGREIPSVAQARESANAAQRSVDQYKRNFVRTRKKLIKSSTIERDQVALLNKQVGFWQSRMKLLTEQYDKLREEINEQNSSTVDLETSQDRVNQLMAEVEEKAAKLAQLDIEVEQPDRVELLQRATVPQTPNRIPKWVLIFGAGFVSICLTVASVGGWEFMKARINTSDEVSKRIGLNLVGTLPALSGSGQIFGRPSPAQLESILGDSIDSIRTALIHGAGKDGHRMVMVTSAWDGEGKTTVASQLAVSLARCGRRTLLVDGDLRSPTLHHLFEMPQEQGLSEVLRGEVEIENAIRPTPAEGLKLLGAGHCDFTSIQALENDNLGQLFDRLRSLYDFVIIDSPPVLAFADSLLMGQYVDGAILSMRLDVSQRPKIEEARDRLKAVDIRLFGGVVNGVKVATSHRAFERSLPAVTNAETETA